MGKNLARMEIQVFLQELTRRLPHLKLAEQRFSYVANTSFRGPEHLWVEWDPARNPERTAPAVLDEDLAGADRRAVEARHRPDACRSSASCRRPTASSGCAWSRPTAATCRAGRRARTSTSSAATPACRASTPCAATRPTRKAFEIAVLREAESRGGSAWMHGAVRPGDRLHVSAPRNHFRLDESARRLIFVAGGIGITPIAAMARRARELGIDYALHYSGRRRTAMALVDELAGLHGERLHLHVSEEGGRNDLDALLRRPSAGTLIYACGPARMLDALARASAHWPEGSLRVEHFSTGKGRLDPTREHGFEVELADSGLVLPVRADQTLLAALRAANIDIRLKLWSWTGFRRRFTEPLRLALAVYPDARVEMVQDGLLLHPSRPPVFERA